ncbi:uncharacterized protein LOC135693257 [Rhopilema esculentum]|uniref:uncharacterized protein LOC135693257 n=1 Tax=Rhopilema esculentum TaxID=499914 RepID=UPI0031D08952|eukprot:gene10639-19380_t
MAQTVRLRLILGITLFIAFSTTAPIAAKPAVSRDKYAAIYDSLKKPLGDILEVTRSTAMSFAKEKKLDNVGLSEGLLEMCQSYIGENNVKSSKERQKRFVYVMKVYQELVKQVQKVQISESKLNGGKCSVLLKKIRRIEFKLRDFVETTLRNAATDIIENSERKMVPSYSVGNDHLAGVDSMASDVSKKNLEILNAILLCTENFLKNDVMQVAGNDALLTLVAFNMKELKSDTDRSKGVNGATKSEELPSTQEEKSLHKNKYGSTQEPEGVNTKQGGIRKEKEKAHGEEEELYRKEGGSYRDEERNHEREEGLHVKKVKLSKDIEEFNQNKRRIHIGEKEGHREDEEAHRQESHSYKRDEEEQIEEKGAHTEEEESYKNEEEFNQNKRGTHIREKEGHREDEEAHKQEGKSYTRDEEGKIKEEGVHMKEEELYKNEEELNQKKGGIQRDEK